MYSVIWMNYPLLKSVARFESHALAAEWVSRRASPDSYLIIAEV